MSINTKNILVEITSSDSLEICKKVMEKMIEEMLLAGLVSKEELNDKVEALKIEGEKSSEESEESSKLRNSFLIQQVKIVDSKANLKSVYPSRVDLTFENTDKIKVVRLYDEN